MIRLKLKAFGKEHVDVEVVDGELLSDAVTRATEGVPLDERKHSEVFQVLLDGHKIDPGLWGVTRLVTGSQVLIAPTIEGDDGQLMRSVLSIIVIAAATYFLGPIGATYGSAALAAATAAVSMVGAMVINALIPPPVPSAGGLAETGGSISSSQMYSIQGQSNQAKPYQYVPKVYGQHRMFPNLAANPYIEITTDPGNPGKFIQTLYAIYDFGLGPCYVSELKIGDTGIEAFPDLEMNFVDPNMPDTSQGSWDDQTIKTFQLYKGDVEVDSSSITLDSNRSDTPTPPEDAYQAVRNAAPNPSLVSQEIGLSFVCTRGLYGASPSGAFSKRSIDMEIHFARVSDPPHATNWMAANDFDHVSSFSEDGGFDQYKQQALEVGPWNPSEFAILNPYGTAVSFSAFSDEIAGATLPPKTGSTVNGTKYEYGFKKGTIPNFLMKTNSEIVVGSTLRCTLVPKPGQLIYQKITAQPTSHFLGKVAQIIPVNETYTRYVMDRPATSDVTIYTRLTGTLYSSPQRNIARQMEAEGKIFLERGVVGKGKISRDSTEAQYATFKFTPRIPGEYKIRVTRVAATSTYTTQTEDSLSWLGVTTRFARNPIVTDKRHKFLELKIRATGQLNGVVQNLSGIVTSALDVYNGTTWAKQLTQNPAWIFADLMTGEVNKRAIEKSRLHTPSLLEWAAHCDEVPEAPATGMTFVKPRFQCNFILDYPTTLQDLLNSVSHMSQASLNIIGGKYGVLLDVEKTVPVQVFTPRNSRNFSSRRVYTKKPDALKVKYVDYGNNWEQTEAIIYDNGFTAANATEFDDSLTAFGCTNHEQAWRFGRYMLAQNRLRQETISLEVDFEHIVCTRGDYVKIAQDVMKAGGHYARVKSISGNRVVVDNKIETDPDTDYGFTYRSTSTGEIKTSTLTVVNSNTFDLDGADLPAKGDLIVIGPVGQITFDCIVKSITPGDDMSAQLVLVEKADAIYEAESTTDFPVYDPQINTTTNAQFRPPGKVTNLAVIANAYNILRAGYEYYIDLDWDAPPGSAFELFEIYVSYGNGFDRVGTTRDSYFRYIVDERNLGVEHAFRVVAVSSGGRKLEIWSVDDVSATPMRKTTRPSNVPKFVCDITGEVLQLYWDKVPDQDIKEYQIRYSPDTDDSATWYRSTPLLKKNGDETLAATQARTGTYLIKAVDFNDNQSESPTAIITTIPQLFGLNVVEELDDFPDLEGVKEKVEQFVDDLILRQEVAGGPDTRKYFNEGFYYLKNLVNLGDIYSVRLQSAIRAIGFTEDDVMSNWEMLTGVILLTSAQSADWDVEFQYRATTEFNVMSAWASLSDVEAMDSGNPDDWTPWRKFTIGDATGRIFQFRLRLVSNKSNITPRVTGATVRIDTPDRTESYQDRQSTLSGYVLEYDPPFLGPDPSPSVQITIQDGAPGDYVEFVEKDLEGFEIIIRDSNGDPVERLFDVQVKGYGRKANQVI